MSKRLLILGGTGEAAHLATQAIDTFGTALDVISSLAGRVNTPRPLPGRVRVGGFGGRDGLVRYIKAEKIDLLIDATHPFATAISANAHGACDQTGTPRLVLVRPHWPTLPHDAGIEVDDLVAAAQALPKLGTRAFLSFGQGGIEAFSHLSDTAFVVRLIDAPEKPLALPHATVTTGRPPFTVEGEKALFKSHGIDVLVSKNSGGTAVPAKITAALELEIPTVLITRPPTEPGPHADSIEQALGWISGHAE